MSEHEQANSEEVIIDDEFEISEDIAEEMGTQGKMKKLREQLKAAKVESAENLDGWQRARADFANYKSEQDLARKEISRRAKESLFEELLPTFDAFDMAMANREVWESVDQNWRVGIEYIYQQLKTAMENHGITKIADTDVAFDPKLHIPLETVSVDDDSQRGKVTEIIQAGYQSKDTVLRPAKVKVGE